MRFKNYLGGTTNDHSQHGALARALILLAVGFVGGCAPAVSPGPETALDVPPSVARETVEPTATAVTEAATADVVAAASAEEAVRGLPRLLDLGASKCIPCKMMAPILDDLKETYADTFETVFIDVWENSAEAEKYGIQSIPTQIFFDASGKELFRHEGFISKEDILAKWKEFGVDRKGGSDV
jgi:thioredoxin 1